MKTLQLTVGTVAVCNNDRLVVICEFAPTGIRVRDLATGEIGIATASQLSAPKDPTHERLASRQDAALTHCTARQWQRAKQREALVVAVLTRDGPILANLAAAAQQYNVSARSLRRWIGLYRQWPSPSALLSSTWGNQRGSRRLEPSVEALISQAVDALFLTRPKATCQVVFEEVQRRCTQCGVRTPSLNAVIRRIKALDPWIVARHQLGREEALRQVGPKPGSLEASAPLAIVQIDHTLVDLHVVDEVHRKSIGRPWITLAIDVASRCVLGFHLSLEAPSTASVAACIAHACLPKERWLAARGIDAQWPLWGLPQRLHADNAREFKTDALAKGCAQWNIEMVWRPLGKPHYGGHIERLIGTLMGRVHLLPGTTQANPVKRGRYPAEAAARLTLAELERWIALELCERYHLSVHRRLRTAPIHAWQDWFAQRGGAAAIPDDAQRFWLSFMPIVYRKLQRSGLHFSGIRYWDNVLPTIARLGGTILLRYDPSDLSRLFALDGNGRYWPIPYADLRQPAITLAEAKAAIAAHGHSERARRQEYRVFEGVLKQREVVKAAAHHSKLARRTQQRNLEAMRPTAAEAGSAAAADVDYSQPAVEYPVEIWQER